MFLVSALGVLAVFAGVLLMNVYCIPAQDELAYGFAGQSTPMAGEVARIATLGDVVRLQLHDYTHGGNGRILVHGVVTLFALLHRPLVFDIVNALVWMAFVLVLMRAGGVTLSLPNYLRTFLAAFALLWYAQSCSLNSAFAVNYLWMALLTLAMMHLWLARPSAWWAPVFFLYGWTQETFVLPFLFAAGVECVLSLKFKVSGFGSKTPMSHVKCQAVNLVALALGAAGLVLGPGARGRAGAEYASSFWDTVLGMLAVVPSALLYVAPAILAGLLLLAVRRTSFRRVFGETPFLSLYLLAAVLMCCALPHNFSPRLLMPASLAAFVIILCADTTPLSAFITQDPNDAHPLSASTCEIVQIILILWFSYGVGMQIACGRDNARAIAEYVASPHGTCTRTRIPLVGFTVDRGRWSPWHLMLFQREYEKPMPPTFKNRRLENWGEESVSNRYFPYL